MLTGMQRQIRAEDGSITEKGNVLNTYLCWKKYVAYL